jgi:hypothetical protein
MMVRKRNTEALVVGGGYSGILLSSLLIDRGFKVLVADSLIESEIEVFSRLKVLNSHYREFIQEYREILSQYKVEILGTTITKTEKREKWMAESPDFIIEAEEVFLCMGCYDRRAFPCKILGTRPAGVFTLQNALELLSKGYRIGSRVLLLGKSRIFEVICELLKALGYEFDVADGEAEVLGKERVEGVLVEGELFSCDTLIYFCGREEFNPFGLDGIKAGNINARSYDYGEVRRDVLGILI